MRLPVNEDVAALFRKWIIMPIKPASNFSQQSEERFAGVKLRLAV